MNYKILSDLVSFNTIEDLENEKIIEYIKNYLKDMKFKVITISNKSNKKSLIATYGNHPNLCFIGHSDTVRCSNNWTTVPHKLTIKNDKMYGLNCELNEWYQRTIEFTKGSRLYDFFFRYEISHYTNEECKAFNKYRKKYHYSEPARKVGQEYLKRTCVIIDLQTGEESPIEIPEFRRGYIVYDKYYRPENERAIYDVKTGKLVLKHGYDKVESDNYVFFDAARNYNESKKVLMLNKETGEVKEWV